MKKYFSLALIVLTFSALGIAFAQDSQRSGVVVAVSAIDGLGHRPEDFAALVPISWLASSDQLPRYNFEIVPSVEDEQLCVFENGASAISRREDITVTITDLE